MRSGDALRDSLGAGRSSNLDNRCWPASDAQKPGEIEVVPGVDLSPVPAGRFSL
jgi:hypothetical protein